MTTLVQTTDTDFIGTLAPGDTLIVAPGVTITDLGILAPLGTTIELLGVTHGAVGIALVPISPNTIDTNHVVTIGTTGTVSGYVTGMSAVGGNNIIVNHGFINGVQYGVQLYSGAGADLNYLTNFGTISAATGNAVDVGGNGAGLTLRNYGTIMSGPLGTPFAIHGSDGAEMIYNHALIIGAIDLGAGNDLFDNRGGTVEGTIALGDGDDTFIAGAADVTVDGGTGTNTLDFSHAQGALTLALDGSLDPGGWAQGDTLTNFQNVTGAAHAANTLTGDANDNILIGGGKADVLRGGDGNDKLYGGGGADKLYGGAGNDVLSGGAGNDTLYGGGGNDYMTGGSGADRFVFTGSDLAGNPAVTIPDFSQGDKDLIDLKGIDANALLSGHQGFSFIGNAAFDGGAGELHYRWIMAGPTGSSPRTVIEGDINGDGTADFSITLFGHIAMTQGDLVL